MLTNTFNSLTINNNDYNLINQINILYYYGDRWPQIHHARMRIGCSKLNNDLTNKLHVIDNASCACGHPIEDANHFFLECPLHHDLREELLDEINGLCEPTIENLIHGSLLLPMMENRLIFDAVHSFITNTTRFDFD